MTDREADNDRRWGLLRSKLNETYLKKTVLFLRSNGIDPILIKGWAIGREYPSPVDRSWSDFDFCVPADEFENCLRLLTEAQLEGAAVDLHRELRHLDTLEWDDLFANSVFASLDGVEIRILRPEDHLRVLCTHWLTDGGAYREKLRDILYLIENHRSEFDWQRSIGTVSATRRNWVVTTVAVARRFAGLDATGLPFEEETRSVPAWMLKALQREWSDGTRLEPLHLKLLQPSALWRQVRKRLPPNPIQATVEFEMMFDETPRMWCQVKSILLRISPSIGRVVRTLGLNRRARAE